MRRPRAKRGQFLPSRGVAAFPRSRHPCAHRRSPFVAARRLTVALPRRPIFASGTFASAAGEADADGCADASPEAQPSQPPQAPRAPSAEVVSHRAARRRPRKEGARAVTRPSAPSNRRRRPRGPSDDTAYPALRMSASPTRESSMKPFMGLCPPSTERLGDRIGNPGCRVGQCEHVRRHDERVAPRVGFALHRRESRQALRREHVPREQRQRRRQAP